MKMIVAVDDRWGIGKDGDLLISIPEDMQYYRENTRGKVVVMGYTTLLSLPGSRPQPGRLNIVLNDQAGCRVPGAVVCGSMEQLLRLIGCFEPDEVFNIGGGSMYRQLTPYCSQAHITRMRFDGGADTFITNLDELPEWSVESETEIRDHEGLKYSFAVYRNSSPEPIPMAAKLSSSMAQYFKKKEPLPLPCGGPSREDIHRVYMRPLENGFSAEEVDRYFREAADMPFEDYLRSIGQIARREDVLS